MCPLFSVPFFPVVADVGVPFEQRSLPSKDKIERSLIKYEVLKPIEGVKPGTAAPWFDQPGGCTQHKLPMKIEELIEQGYIRKISG
ncbi:TNT domain-containing protein [Thalassospira tepidiphila]|uniref:TNT domain-containing protein n=1 Tax=Thalassospira tepidiphila TaxID=393657 RepID=UPI003CC82B29